MCWCDNPDCERTAEPRCYDCGNEGHRHTYCGGCHQAMCPHNPHRRFYCPLCKEVHCGAKRQGEWIVLPHYRVDTEDINREVILGKPCRGGPVNYEKDRAP